MLLIYLAKPFLTDATAVQRAARPATATPGPCGPVDEHTVPSWSWTQGQHILEVLRGGGVHWGKIDQRLFTLGLP